MKFKIIVASLVAAVALGLGGIYYLAGTPQYSLYLLRNAVREGDRDTFYHHFDLSRVIGNAVDRVVGGIHAGPGVVSREARELAVPNARRVLTRRIDERIGNPGDTPIVNMSIESVRYDGPVAYVTLRDAATDSTTTIVLERMRNRKWKVVDLDLSKANIPFQLSDMM